jgi:hypothetical protein
MPHLTKKEGSSPYVGDRDHLLEEQRHALLEHLQEEEMEWVLGSQVSIGVALVHVVVESLLVCNFQFMYSSLASALPRFTCPGSVFKLQRTTKAS